MDPHESATAVGLKAGEDGEPSIPARSRLSFISSYDLRDVMTEEWDFIPAKDAMVLGMGTKYPCQRWLVGLDQG